MLTITIAYELDSNNKQIRTINMFVQGRLEGFVVYS